MNLDRPLHYIWVVVCFLSLGLSSQAGEISSSGHRLLKALDSMNVEQLWLAKNRVNWKTGESLGASPADGKSHTHCSAFVAAACLRMEVYILRPPEHATTMLANAQYDWLQGEGKSQGWAPVASSLEAQRLANGGSLVVAVYKENRENKHGHIALVRPSTKSNARIESEGPQITQAGMENYLSASLKEGFKHHPSAWKHNEVRFFVHELKWK